MPSDEMKKWPLCASLIARLNGGCSILEKGSRDVGFSPWWALEIWRRPRNLIPTYLCPYSDMARCNGINIRQSGVWFGGEGVLWASLKGRWLKSTLRN